MNINNTKINTEMNNSNETHETQESNNSNKINNITESIYDCPESFPDNAGSVLNGFRRYSVNFVNNSNITTRIESHKLNNDTCKLVVNMFSSNTFNENKNPVDTLIIESIPFTCKNETKPSPEYVDKLIHGLNYYLYHSPYPITDNIKSYNYIQNTNNTNNINNTNKENDKKIEHLITIKNEKLTNGASDFSFGNYLMKISNFISDIGLSKHDIKIRNTLSAFLYLDWFEYNSESFDTLRKRNIFNYSDNKFEINTFTGIDIGKIEYKFINDTNNIFPQIIQNKGIIYIFKNSFKKVYGLDYYKTLTHGLYYYMSDSNIFISRTNDTNNIFRII